ncbi:Uncharacterised protein [Mycobacteroides abscessus subsp. massiliense]|nr:Uncharacterised protein [Mycobacteroides abscessus subsp. massiliense]
MINILSQEQGKAIWHFKDKLNISLVNLNWLDRLRSQALPNLDRLKKVLWLISQLNIS